MSTDKTGYSESWWKINYPVQLFRETNGSTSYTMFQPFKSQCVDSLEDNEIVSKEQEAAFIDQSIAKFEKAIEMFKRYKKGEVNEVVAWSEETGW